jgi:hypothetical protein
LQTHLDKWSNKEEPKNYPPPQGLNPALYKVFEKKNTAIREPSHKLELQDRLKEWLQELR